MRTACWTHTSLSSHTRVFSTAARYYWPLRSLPSRLGSKRIDFRKRIPFCFCGAILQYCGFEPCSLELCGWFRGAPEGASRGRAGKGEDFSPITPPLPSTARALLWSVSCTWIPPQFYFGWETMWLSKEILERIPASLHWDTVGWEERVSLLIRTLKMWRHFQSIGAQKGLPQSKLLS